jgi:CRISPR-associated protein Cas2
MWYAIAYDIVDDGRRNKIASTLEAYGDRVQYSVFECNLNRSELKELTGKLKEHLDPKVDSIRIYMICESCKGKMEVIGRGMRMGEQDEINRRTGWVV